MCGSAKHVGFFSVENGIVDRALDGPGNDVKHGGGTVSWQSDLLARAHCISMECGIESITEEGRDELNKDCALDTARITELLIYARRRVPWVQANLILTEHDQRDQIRGWQEDLKKHGVWVSEPVPMFPFPGTPDYQRLFGPPDDQAWERAHSYYLGAFRDKGFSDIQEAQPASLEDLECTF